MDIDAKTNLQPISVERLQVGMFVADLDCAWSDTPFQYQGFQILSESEIEILERHCKTVFVDPSHAGVTARHGVTRKGAQNGETYSATQAIDAQRLRLLSRITDHVAHKYGESKRRRHDARDAITAFDHARIGVAKLLDAISQGKAVEAKHCRGVVEPIAKCVVANPDIMCWLTFINKSEPQIYDRRIATAVWCAVFARYLGVAPPTLLDIASGGLLLDIGWTKIAGNLREHDGVYVGRERLAMQSHVRLGFEILQSIPGTSDRVRQMQAQHHERGDGSGYPNKLQAESITPFGSIAGVVDCYDAMITDTSYRPALSSADAIGELRRQSDTLFPKLVVEQFVQALGMFPSGSIVELNSGEIAIVIQQDPKHRLRPTVLIVCDQQKELLSQPREVRLAQVSRDAKTTGALWIVCGHATGTYGIYPQSFFS